MWSKLARNCILMGPADAYCLVCETHLLDEHSAELHVSKPVHQKTLDAVGYYEKFKDDLIRKVPCGYYCEACACVSVTAAACSLHVASARHRERVQRRLRRLASGALVCGGRLLAADAWQGLVGDTCVLCCADVTDRAAHITEKPHVLKLVQTELIYDSDIVYRKIDSDTYHCLICNDLFSKNYFEEHFQNLQHVNSLILDESKKSLEESLDTAKNETTDIEKEIVQEDTVINKKCESAGKINTDSLLDSVAAFQKGGVNIDFIHERAYCKKCLKDIPFDSESIQKHIDDHQNEPKKEHTKVPFESSTAQNKYSLYTKPVFIGAKENTCDNVSVVEMAALIKDNGLFYKKQKLYCKICNTRVAAMIEKVKEHILSNAHKDAQKLNVPRPVKKEKIRLEVFLERITMVQDGEQLYNVIDQKFCVNVFSFMFVGKKPYSGSLGCLACNVSLPPPPLLFAHIASPAHVKAMEESYVIVIDSEFVREIKPDLYHCGFCNSTSVDWESMTDHLVTAEHKNAKRTAHWRLEELRSKMADESVADYQNFVMGHFMKQFYPNE